MSQFINARETLVTDAIDGLLRSGAGQLARLDGYPHVKVVVRRDRAPDKVALICGGGAGHEPSHAGFVGRGMLTAAVCGEVFASPSVEAVLAGILAVTGEAGCLLIVKNYTGDRLNFGLAAERARASGLKVRMVIVGDDIALPESVQPRGVAGTLLVHKIAGAAAEAGASLDTVADTAERVADGVRTLGMSLDTCTVPGSAPESRIAEGHAELGLGIHGEPGVEEVALESARQAMALVVERLARDMSDTPHVALLNNLGATTSLEMAILAEALLSSPVASRLRCLIGPAPLMTALDMHGFSLSVLPVNEKDVQALHAEVAPFAWPGVSEPGEIVTEPLPDGLSPPRPPASQHPARRALIERACRSMVAAEQDLNSLDAKSGDGDTGSTVAGAARALHDALDRLPLADEAQLLRGIGAELAQTMGGSSGVLLAILFSAAGDASTGGADVRDALLAGLTRVQEVGGAQPGDRTMVDALLPALQVLEQGASAAAEAARAGAEHTGGMTRAKAGRSSYVGADKLVGNNDPGAEAVARLFEALAEPG